MRARQLWEQVAAEAAGVPAGLAGRARQLWALVRESGGAVTTLIAARQGVDGQYLVDSEGQLTDSGSPLYRYSGEGGSDEVLVEATGPTGAPIVDDDVVGVPWAEDTISGGAWGALAGVPGSQRLAGMGPCSAVDHWYGGALPGGTTSVSWLVLCPDYESHAKQNFVSPGLNEGPGFHLYRFGGTLYGVMRTGVGNERIPGDLINLGGDHSGTVAVAGTYDGGTGTLRLYLFDASGALLASSTATAGAGESTVGPYSTARVTDSAYLPYQGTGWVGTVWTTAVDAATLGGVVVGGAAAAEAAGAYAHLPGLLTGCYLAADPSVLLTAAEDTPDSDPVIAVLV